MIAQSSLGTALELFHRYGLWPLAIHPGRKIPVGWSRCPIQPTEKSLRNVFSYYCDAGVGLLLGPDGGVVDFECDSQDGLMSFLELFEGRIPPTLGWSSARGPHFLFQHGARISAYGKDVLKPADLPGLEIRIGSPGSPVQSICPPTVGTDQVPRKWNKHEIIASIPDSVFAWLDSHDVTNGPEWDGASSDLDDLSDQLMVRSR